MNKITKAGMTLVIAGALAAGNFTIVSAHTGTTTPGLSFAQRIMVRVNGKVVAAGTVQSLTSDGFTLSTWGGVWTVKTATSTKFSLKTGLSAVKVGDVVTVSGTVSKDSPTVITAAKVEDKAVLKASHENKKEAKKEIKELRKGDKGPGMLRGGATVQSIVGTTITLQGKNASTTRTITTDANTKFYSKAWLPITLGDIKVGDILKPFGNKATTSLSLHAALIQDLSL